MAPTPPTSSDAQAALEKKLSEIGVNERALSSAQLADSLGLPYSELKGLPIDPEALAQVPQDQARAAALALIQATGKAAAVVVLDPRTSTTASEIETLRERYPDLKIIVVSPDTLEAVLSRYATIQKAHVFETGSISVDDALVAQAQENIKTVTDLKNQLQQVSVTQLFEILIAGALATGASDIHFEPEADVVRLRYRLDGLLHTVADLDKPRYQRVLNRLKVLSKMKLNITKAPQDGRFTIHQDHTEIEVRVSVLPSEYGESVVMRLLDPRTIHAKLGELGMRPDVLAQVKELLSKPQGALLTTGPTGSGKTTTLYAFLSELNTPDMKIITVEDPIEYHIQGVNQTQIEPEKGYTFASGLRAIVRQDPDIILIGEIRDLETAGIALEAALTGHLVLSTIHTNDAAGTIPRLIDLGIKPETIAPALTMAMGQRLVRRLCPQCKKKTSLAGKELTEMREALEPIQKRLRTDTVGDNTPIFEPTACQACNGTGYKGRVGVYEVFGVTREMEQLILSNPSVSAVRDLAIKDGMITMLQDGYLKVLEGITSIEEVHRVLG